MRDEPTFEMIASLRQAVRPYYKESRYRHALSVEREAAYMAETLLPEREESIRAASLFHDIAKKLSYEKQLNYIREFDIMDEGKTPVEAVAHAAAGAAMVMAHFPEYALDPELVSAIRYHSTGRAGMTVFEAIVFLADYIEPGRQYESCRNLREAFHRGIEAARTKKEKLEVLRRSVMVSLGETISYVRSQGGELDGETISALSYFDGGGEFADSLLKDGSDDKKYSPSRQKTI